MAAPRLKASETILLVEDSELLGQVTRYFLEGDGYQVLFASNPEEAIRIAETHDAPIDLLLTDMALPEMNGGQLSEKPLAKRPDMKVLYMSGYTSETLSEQTLKPEPVAFLEKPFSHQALSWKVRHALHPSAP